MLSAIHNEPGYGIVYPEQEEAPGILCGSDKVLNLKSRSKPKILFYHGGHPPKIFVITRKAGWAGSSTEEVL